MARSGSEKRQRQITLKARFDDREAALIKEQADRAGVSVAALIRFAVLDQTPLRASRRPSVNHETAAQLLGNIGPLKSALVRAAEVAESDALEAEIDRRLPRHCRHARCALPGHGERAMILKGSQRGNGSRSRHPSDECLRQRAVSRSPKLHGAVADDLHGAFAEFEAVASGTRAKQYLYSLSINPSAPLTREQYDEAIAAIEDRLGLAGQPRAIVFHVKHGREHCHVVWSRIDAEKMRAIHMAHDHRRLCDLACELARKYGLDLPPGLKAWEQKQRFEKDKLDRTLAENAQKEKTGIIPDERRAEITACYDQSDSAASFRAALEQKGYLLAKGDRRGFVIVDRYGDVHSLSRYVKGHTAKQIKAKLAPLTPEQLPAVDEAKEQMRQRAQAAQEVTQEQARKEETRAAEEKVRAEKARHAEIQTQRRAAMAAAEQELLVRQASEKLALHAAQQGESRRLLFRVRSAVTELIGRTPGLRSVLGPIQKLTHLDPQERHRLEREALARRHAREKLEIERRKRALGKIEAREAKAMELALLRLTRRAKAIEPEVATSFKARQEFFEAARDQGLWRKRAFKEGDLTVDFNDAAEFAEGADRADDEGEDLSPDWKSRTEKVSRGHRPRRGKGKGYRDDD